MKSSFNAIGLMSGTSLDGLDIAHCRFVKKRRWNFRIIHSRTIAYSAEWKDRLATAPLLSGAALHSLHSEYGAFLGEQCSLFMKANKIRKVDLIASHGHTIFHQIDRKFTFQLGDGNVLRAITEMPVVYDFRSLDVALNGQGAPLVPVGDRHLFGDFDICLNLGGIANVSMETAKKRIAFDICFANMGLNYLAAKADLEFDKDGRMASRGKVDSGLLELLHEATGKYAKQRPALGREGFETDIQPLLDTERISLEDRMRTFCVSIADEIMRSIPTSRKIFRMLVTGGGANHPLLISLLREKLIHRVAVEIPDRRVIDFKEATVFAFLGVLRLRGEVNVLKSVTRADRDSCSGVLLY